MDIRAEIKNYFNDIIFSSSGLRKRIKNAPVEYIKYCEDILNQEPEWLKLSYVIIGICKDIQLRYCKTCGKKLTYLQLRKDGYCSRRCVVTNTDIRIHIQSKTLKTNLEKYGCKSPAQAQSVKDKIKNTCLKKYGTTSVLSSNIVREKIIKTNLEKYGVENVYAADEIKEKIKQTNLNRYGNEVYVKSEDFKQKSTQSLLDRYGVNSIFSSPEIYHKGQNTVLQKYNVSNSFLLPKTIENAKKQKYLNTWKTISTWSEYVIPLFSLDEYTGQDNTEYTWKCVKCGNIFKQKIYTTHFNAQFRYLPRCLHCFPFVENLGISNSEKVLCNFIKQYFNNVQENNRELISPYELDIVIPELKLAIEFNGIFWHNTLNKPAGYHKMKTDLCEAIGYHLIQIWEDDWLNNQEDVKAKLFKIFHKEEEKFTDETLCLDRDWYQKKKILGYILTEVQEPKIISRDLCECENSGYLCYKKINNG